MNERSCPLILIMFIINYLIIIFIWCLLHCLPLKGIFVLKDVFDIDVWFILICRLGILSLLYLRHLRRWADTNCGFPRRIVASYLLWSIPDLFLSELWDIFVGQFVSSVACYVDIFACPHKSFVNNHFDLIVGQNDDYN